MASWRCGLAVAALLTFLAAGSGFGVSVWFLTPGGHDFLNRTVLLNESGAPPGHNTTGHPHPLSYHDVRLLTVVVMFSAALCLCTSVLMLESACARKPLGMSHTGALLLAHATYIGATITAAIALARHVHVTFYDAEHKEHWFSFVLVALLVCQAILQFVCVIIFLVSTDDFRNGCTSIPRKHSQSTDGDSPQGIKSDVRYQPIN